jgi:oxygen-dependent protoporphyrinogen oxidase
LVTSHWVQTSCSARSAVGGFLFVAGATGQRCKRDRHRGGGISGLSLAFELLNRGASVLLFEAASRVGGTIQSTVDQGFITEAGPNGFLDREPATRALATALGLTDRIRPADAVAKKRFIFTRGALREVPSSPPAFLKSNILPFTARLRVALELFTRRRRDAEDETLADFARRHLGEAATRVLIDAMQAGIFAGNPEKLSLAATFPKMAELERDHRSLILAMVRLQKQRRGTGIATETSGPSGTLCSFEGGLETLTRTLGESLAPSIRRSEARSIARLGTGWRLQISTANAEEWVEAERLVLAVPSYVAARLLRPLDGALAAELDAIQYAPVCVVHLGYPRIERAVPNGFGFLVPSEEKMRILGAIFISSIFPWRSVERRTLLTCMVAGARQPELFDLSDAELLNCVRQDLQRALGLSADPSFHRVSRWQRGIPQYNVGHLARLRRIDAQLSKLPGLSLTGNAFRGVGLNDCIRNSAALAKKLMP